MKFFKIILTTFLSFSLIGCTTQTQEVKKKEEEIIVRNIETTLVDNQMEAGQNAVDILALLSEHDNNRFIYTYEPLGYNNIEIDMTHALNAVKQVTGTFGYDFNIQKFYNDYFDNMNLHTDVTPVKGVFGPSGIIDYVGQYYMDNDILISMTKINHLNFITLSNIVNNNWPVMVWYTLDESQFGEEIQYWPFSYEMIITTIDNENVYLFDPINGKKIEKKEDFQRIWEKCGEYGIIFY